MANTYTQIHIQCIFAVEFRQSVIRAEWKERLQKYITGIVQNNGHKMIAIFLKIWNKKSVKFCPYRAKN